MSILTKLSAVRMQEAALLATECADPKCLHPLRSHYLSLSRPDTSNPRRPACAPLTGPRCKCQGFRESADEQLPGIK